MALEKRGMERQYAKMARGKHHSSNQQWVRWFINPTADVLCWYIHFTFLYLNCVQHAVIYFVSL